MKTKSAAIFLMVSSIFWIISDVYWTIQRFTGPSWDYYKDNPLDMFFSTLNIIIPISLLILAFSLMREKSGEQVQAHNTAVLDQDVQNISVGDWLVNFLITAIPLIGFIFTIIWANDEKNKIRKNWAIASLIWAGIILVIAILLYATIFAAIIKNI